MTLFKIGAFPQSRLGVLHDSESDQAEDLAVGNELAILSHAIEHEVFLHEQRGMVQGEIRLHFANGTTVDCHGGARIPEFPSPEVLQIERDPDRGVLVVTHRLAYEALLTTEHVRRSFDVVCCHGIPRLSARWFTRRMSDGSPIFFLGDRSTWSLFSVAVLASGTAIPGSSELGLSMPVHFVGIRASASLTTKEAKPYWVEQLDALSEYPCFSSKEWQAEIDMIRSSPSKVRLFEAIEEIGVERFTEEFITDKVRDAIICTPI